MRRDSAPKLDRVKKKPLLALQGRAFNLLGQNIRLQRQGDFRHISQTVSAGADFHFFYLLRFHSIGQFDPNQHVAASNCHFVGGDVAAGADCEPVFLKPGRGVDSSIGIHGPPIIPNQDFIGFYLHSTALGQRLIRFGPALYCHLAFLPPKSPAQGKNQDAGKG